jgi:hypothetical protein
MDRKIKDVLKESSIITGLYAAGAVVGRVVTNRLGGMGLALMGTAVPVPVPAIAAGLGLCIGTAHVVGRWIERFKRSSRLEAS